MIKQLTIALGSAALLSLAASAAYADDVTTDYGPQATTVKNSGFYLGGDLGYRWAHEKSRTIEESRTILNHHINTNVTMKGDKTGGMAARVDAGYEFNQYLSAELGYTYLGSYKSKFSAKVAGRAFPTHMSLNRSLYAFDAMGKVTYPFANNMFVFGGFGAAYVHTDNTSMSFYGFQYDLSDQSMIRPEAELGVGYKLNDNVSMDVSYKRIFGKGNSINNNGINKNYLPNLEINKKYLPNLDMLGVGLTYKF